MGQSSPKQFTLPTTFGGTPQTNNVTQAQQNQTVQGPGFAAIGGFDQTQQGGQPQQQQNPFMANVGGGGEPSPLLGNRKNLMSQNLNPFTGLVNQ